MASVGGADDIAVDGKPFALKFEGERLGEADDAALRHAIHQTKGMTVFIVSQRATSIKQADKILVLDDGRVVGQGTHETLLEQCPVYQEIYHSQFRKEAHSHVS